MLKNLYLLIVSLFVCNIINSQVVIKGHISEFDGGALIGATVVEKGTNNGTLADVDGNFTITLNTTPATLVFSYVGFTPQEIEVTAQTTLRIILEADSYSLSQVEVLGTRSLNRSSTESMVPIDIIDVSAVTAANGQLDLNQLLQYAAPSFNSKRR